MKKVLFTANSDRHILLCHLPYLKWFKDNNFYVDVITNTDKKIEYSDNKYNIGMKRTPYSLKNIKACFKLKKILVENNYDLIHTNTPVGSVVTRIACLLSKTKAKIIYTCHGFHFYKGAPIYYWLLFYPIEKFLMKMVDVLIVMNNEDYLFAKKHFKNTDIRLINGVGFNKQRLNRKVSKKEINKIYRDLNTTKNDFIVTYIAEYSSRKRQKNLIKYLSKTDVLKTNIKLLLIGDDTLDGKLRKVIDSKGLNSVIKLVDFTDDICPYLDISNVVISFSRQEGLPLNVMEAIYKNKMLIVSGCRGNIDLVKDNINGFIVDNERELYEKIKYVSDNYNELMKKYDRGIDIMKYSADSILEEVSNIYMELL